VRCLPSGPSLTLVNTLPCYAAHVIISDKGCLYNLINIATRQNKIVLGNRLHAQSRATCNVCSGDRKVDLAQCSHKQSRANRFLR